MSAAATAAGYLYSHGQRLVSGVDGNAIGVRVHHTADSRATRDTGRGPERVPDQRGSPKQAAIPKIEYRRRRAHILPPPA